MTFFKFSYSKKEYYKSLFLFVFTLVFLLVVSIFFIYRGWEGIHLNIISLAIITGIFVGIIFVYVVKLFYFLFAKYGDWLIEKMRIAKLGFKGEEEAFAEIEKAFGSIPNHKLYTNVRLPGRKFDIDAIVLSPAAVYVFEVKNSQQKLYFKHDKTYTKKWTGEDWYPLPIYRDPVQRTMAHIRNLQEYLNIDPSFIKPMLLILNKEKCKIYDDYDRHALPVICGFSEMKEYLKDVPSAQIPTEFYGELMGKLDNL